MRSSTVKRLGVLVVVVGAPLLHLVVPGAFWGRTSAALAGGLLMIFFSKEATHDERVQDLKLRAISTMLPASFSLTLIANWLLNRDFDVTRDFSGATGTWRSISAFDLIVLTMTTSLALFYYWRFQDSQASDDAARTSGASAARS